MIYHKIFLSYIASKTLTLSLTLNCVVKRANNLIASFCFRPASEIWSRFSWMEIIPKPVRHEIEIS